MLQALLNLCTNAIHAMGRGPGPLHVALAAGEPPAELRTKHPQWPPGSLVCLTAADTVHGIGAAEQALELLAGAPDSWALVLSDLNMPRLTGLDLIRRLRTAGNAVPCLLATGFIDSASTEAEAHALGLGEILEKPFTRESLGRAVAAALSAGRPATAVS